MKSGENSVPLQKRHSVREAKPVAFEDLGYTGKDQAKKVGKSASEAYKKCEKILNQLRKLPNVTPFLYPANNLPGYLDTVKEPMDLGAVERKLKSGLYTSPYHFSLDVRKIWNNSWSYNKPGTEMYIATTQISNTFEYMMRDVEDVPFADSGNSEIHELKRKVNRIAGAISRITETASAPAMVSSPRAARKIVEKPMSMQEKATLGQNIRKLPQEKVLEMLQVLKGFVDLSKAKDGLELDLDKLPLKKCRELEQFVKRSLVPKKSSNSASRTTSAGNKKKKIEFQHPTSVATNNVRKLVIINRISNMVWSCHILKPIWKERVKLPQKLVP